MYFKVGFKLFWVTLWLAQKSGTADGRPIFPLFSGRFRPGFLWELLESVLYSHMLILVHWIKYDSLNKYLSHKYASVVKII